MDNLAVDYLHQGKFGEGQSEDLLRRTLEVRSLRFCTSGRSNTVWRRPMRQRLSRGNATR